MSSTALAWRMFLRSFLVQASWNFHRMQNLGFFLIVFPALARREPRTNAELARASLRHLQLFNTHPYFAGLVAGTVVREEGFGEEDLATGLKRSLMCSLGGVGDQFFWAHLRPLTAIVALAFTLQGWHWGPMVFLVLYNIPHLAVRGWGVAAALRRGRRIVGLLQERWITRWIVPFATGIAVLAGFLAGVWAGYAPRGPLPDRGLAGTAFSCGAFSLFILLQARGVSLERLLAGISVLAVVAGGFMLVTAP